MEQIICKLCFRPFDSYKALSAHFGASHKLNSKEYYDLYIMEDGEDKCIVCDQSTAYVSLTAGYNKYCSRDCGFVGKTKKFKRENNIIDEPIQKESEKDLNDYEVIPNPIDLNFKSDANCVYTFIDNTTIDSIPESIKEMDNTNNNNDKNLSYFELVKRDLPRRDFKRHMKEFNSMERERSVTIESYMRAVHKQYKKGY